MRETPFKVWLSSRYSEKSTYSRLYSARRIEALFGDLDEHFDKDELASVLAALAYSVEDGRVGRPSPMGIVSDANPYNSLQNYKKGLKSYRDYRRASEDADDEAADNPADDSDELSVERRLQGRLFELERNLQEVLRGELSQLEPGLRAIDDGREKSVASGLIDIMAEGADSALVVIELKRGCAKRDAIGQILGYMGDVKREFPNRPVRGILVAADFDAACRSALGVLSSVQLKRYQYRFAFEGVET